MNHSDRLTATTPSRSAKGTTPQPVALFSTAVARARQSRGESVAVIARHLKIGRSTLYRALQPQQADLAPVATELAR